MKVQVSGPRVVEACNTRDQVRTKATSKPIFIEGAIGRTPSEVQLMYQEVMADHRDYCMFQRIVTGILSRTKDEELEAQSDVIQLKLDKMPRQSQKVLENIVRTRNQPVTNSSLKTDESSCKWSPSTACDVSNSMTLTDLTKRQFYYQQRDNEYLAGSNYHAERQQLQHLMMGDPSIQFPESANRRISHHFEDSEFFLMDDL